VSAALTPLYVTAAIVLAIAGAAKLRSPAGAAQALSALGVPAGSAAVRAIACGELLLAALCLLRPSAATAAVLALVYASFAGVSTLLARSRSSCGCFGESDEPASIIQSVLSAGIAVIVLAAAAAGPHGTGWLLGRAPASAAVLAVGIAGCAYAIVLAYRELPQAWGAWSRP
jgi:Methylamine utilisation protein MauE